jgi:hypothetical protein
VNIKTILKSSVAATALFALAAPVSTTAIAADDSFSSGQKTSLKMSGFVARAIWHGDDGTSEKTFMSGQPGVPSRIRWVASGTLSDNVTAGATMEMSMPNAYTEGSATLQGATIAADGTDGADTGTWGIRQEYVWVNHKKFGKLSMGHTDIASSSRGEISANGTDYSRSGRNYGRGLNFINTTAAANATSANTVGGVLGDLDVSRTDNLRYDTPTFFGARASVSRHASGETSVGLNYAGKFGALAVKAGAGYIDRSARAGSSNFIALGSIAVTHDSGINLSYQTGKENFSGALSKSAGVGDGNAAAPDTNNIGGRDDPHFHGFQLGYAAPKLVSVGKTAFAVTKMYANNISENDGEAESWSIRVKQSFDALGATMSLSYQNYSYDAESETVVGTITNENYADIDVIALQTTFNF